MQTELHQSVNITDSYTYPGILTRINALTIDGGLIVLVFLLAFNVFYFLGDVPGYIRGSVFIFMLFLYEPLMVSLSGFTIGQYLMKIRVRQFSNPTKNISLPVSFLRTFIKALFGIVSFLTIGFNPMRRAIHDFVSGSIVIEIQ